VTYFPDDALGDARFDYFKKVVNIEPLDKLLAPYTSDMSDVGVALFTFLYVDFLDTSVSNGLRLEDPPREASSSLALSLIYLFLFYRAGNALGTGIGHGIRRRRRQLPQKSHGILS
jgi:hypothetical protein